MSVINDHSNDLRFDVPCGRSEGMSLRDYFAGQALAGLLANHAIIEQYKVFDAALVTKTVASGAYDIADAMLKAREVTR